MTRFLLDKQLSRKLPTFIDKMTLGNEEKLIACAVNASLINSSH